MTCYISPRSPLYLRYISPISPLYLPGAHVEQVARDISARADERQAVREAAKAAKAEEEAEAAELESEAAAEAAAADGGTSSRS